MRRGPRIMCFVLVTHVTLMMDGDHPSISLVFRRPVTHPTHPGLRWDLVSCWLSFHFCPSCSFFAADARFHALRLLA